MAERGAKLPCPVELLVSVIEAPNKSLKPTTKVGLPPRYPALICMHTIAICYADRYNNIKRIGGIENGDCSKNIRKISQRGKEI